MITNATYSIAYNDSIEKVVLTGPSNGAAILVQGEVRGLPGPIMGAASFVR